MTLKLSSWMTVFVIFVVSTMKVDGVDSTDSLNLCADAVNRLSEYRVEGIYGNPLESPWHSTAFYKLIRRMSDLKVIKQEFRDAAEGWFFEFVLMRGAKTVVFVGHKKNREKACKGPNSFFVSKKN